MSQRLAEHSSASTDLPATTDDRDRPLPVWLQRHARRDRASVVRGGPREVGATGPLTTARRTRRRRTGHPSTPAIRSNPPSITAATSVPTANIASVALPPKPFPLPTTAESP